jgi:hypothetical protein
MRLRDPGGVKGVLVQRVFGVRFVGCDLALVYSGLKN